MFDKDKLSELEKRQKDWENGELRKSLEERPEKEPMLAEIPKQRLYTPADMTGFDYVRDLGFPGEYPCTRGISPTMYRSELWTQGLYSGYGLPEDANRRLKLLLSRGDDCVRLAADLPTQLGYDSDHPLAQPEVGRVGVASPSLKEIEIIFDGIPMDRVPIYSSINNPHIIHWCMYMAAAEKRGIPAHKLGGVVVSDFIAEYVARSNYIFPPEGASRLSIDLLEYAVKHVPKLRPEILGHSVRGKGSTAVQEAGYIVATALYFVESMLKRGIAIDDIRLWNWEFHHSIGMNLFEEVAKFRATRRLWARLVKERWSPKDPHTLRIRLGPACDGSTLTAQQPENNIARVTIQALAAILGGSNFLKTVGFDEAYAIPTEKAHTIAIMTQHIVAEESGVTETVDPLGGSYYVESLTNEMEKRILDYVRQIESRGGIVKAATSGWLQSEIAGAALTRQKEIDEGKRVVVGLNKYVIDEKPVFEIHRADPRVAAEMKRRLARLRAERDNPRVQRSLAELRRAAQGTDNLVPFVLEAVKSYATVGEICGVFREVFGEYKPPIFM